MPEENRWLDVTKI